MLITEKVHLLDISAQFFSKVPFGNLKSQRLLFSCQEKKNSWKLVVNITVTTTVFPSNSTKIT